MGKDNLMRSDESHELKEKTVVSRKHELSPYRPSDMRTESQALRDERKVKVFFVISKIIASLKFIILIATCLLILFYPYLIVGNSHYSLVDELLNIIDCIDVFSSLGISVIDILKEFSLSLLIIGATSVILIISLVTIIITLVKTILLCKKENYQKLLQSASKIKLHKRKFVYKRMTSYLSSLIIIIIFIPLFTSILKPEAQLSILSSITDVKYEIIWMAIGILILGSLFINMIENPILQLLKSKLLNVRYAPLFDYLLTDDYLCPNCKQKLIEKEGKLVCENCQIAFIYDENQKQAKEANKRIYRKSKKSFHKIIILYMFINLVSLVSFISVLFVQLYNISDTPYSIIELFPNNYNPLDFLKIMEDFFRAVNSGSFLFSPFYILDLLYYFCFFTILMIICSTVIYWFVKFIRLVFILISDKDEYALFFDSSLGNKKWKPHFPVFLSLSFIALTVFNVTTVSIFDHINSLNPEQPFINLEAILERFSNIYLLGGIIGAFLIFDIVFYKIIKKHKSKVENDLNNLSHYLR